MTASDVPKTSKKRRSRAASHLRASRQSIAAHSMKIRTNQRMKGSNSGASFFYRFLVRIAPKFRKGPTQGDQRQVSDDDQRFGKLSRRVFVDPFPDPKMRVDQNRRHKGQTRVGDDVGRLHPPPGSVYVKQFVNRRRKIAEVPQTRAQAQSEQRYFALRRP